MSRFLRYRDIIFYRTLAGLKSETRQHYLGYLWFLLEPLMTTSVLYFAMSNITGQRGPEVVFALLLGMIVWQWFEGSVMLSAHSIKAKFHVHMQVPLPKYLFPLVDILSNTIKFSFALVIVLTASLLLGRGPSLALCWLPVLLVIQFALIVGVSLVVSIGVTLVSDLLIPISSLFRLLFFVSGIFFTPERVPENLLPYFYANPMAVLIEAYRAVVLYQQPPEFARLNVAIITATVLLAVGVLVQTYFDKRLLKLTNV